jgi:hypothetical protein
VTLLLCTVLAECSALDGLSAAAEPDAADAHGEADDADPDAANRGGDASALDAPVLE